MFKIKINYLLMAMVCFGIFYSCKEDTNQSIKTAEPQFTKEAELRFVSYEGDTLATFAIEIAKTPYEHQTGLMYRKSMEKDQGMIFVYPNERPRYGFYMKNTYISLDLIYIN